MVDEVMSTMNVNIPMIMEMDSLSGIARIRRNGLSETQKTVDIRYKAIKKMINEEDVELQHLRTNEMPADILTKALSTTAFQHKRQLCGVQLKQDKSRLSSGGEVLDHQQEIQASTRKIDGRSSCSRDS